MNGWNLCYEGYDPAAEGLREALCTVGNGYLATRGAAPDVEADGVHYPGTYAAGIFNRLADAVPGTEETVTNESLVNLPNWLPVTFRIGYRDRDGDSDRDGHGDADGYGEWLRLDGAQLLEYHQCLDLRRAVLGRRYRLRDASGRVVAVTERRFADMAFPHGLAQEVTVLAENFTGRIQFRAGVDGRVGNNQIARYRALSSQHLEPVRAAEVAADTVLLQVVTSQSRIGVAMACRSQLWRDGHQAETTRELLHDGQWIGHLLTTTVGEGEAVTLEKAVTVYTSRDHAISEPALDATRWLERRGRFEELLQRHTLAWGRLWQRCRVGVKGDPQAQQLIRLHLAHLLQTVSPHTADLDVGVPARGLHGEAYRGHIFWDELFVFPVLTLRLPELTRALLRYRHRRLPEARQAAREVGLDGAMYPWQSGSDGREESQRLHLNPRSGRWLPDATWRQRHIGIAVAYNTWQYFQATGDLEFLIHHGAEMLVEIARFWSSLASYDRSRDRFVLTGVVGPDEFHTGYPGAEQDGVDNNAYTNIMAAWVLQRAADAVEALPALARRELTDTLGLRAEELHRWDDLSRRLVVPFHDVDGQRVISQFEGYQQLAELDWDGYRRQYGDIQRLDRILEAEGKDVNHYQASKQADVLMLFYLLSAEELGELLERLGYQLDPEWIPRTIDYYLARTSHGSTLSAVVHAWVLARAHRDRAWEFFHQALRADVADIQGGTTAEGIHLAAMAGSVDLVQRCFSGLELRQGRLLLNPYWPKAWGVLTMTIRYRDSPLRIRISGRQVEIAADAGMQQPIEVACRGAVRELQPGDTARFRC